MWNLGNLNFGEEPLWETLKNLVRGFRRMPQTTSKLYWKNPKLFKLLGNKFQMVAKLPDLCQLCKQAFQLQEANDRFEEVLCACFFIAPQFVLQSCHWTCLGTPKSDTDRRNTAITFETNSTILGRSRQPHKCEYRVMYGHSSGAKPRWMNFQMFTLVSQISAANKLPQASTTSQAHAPSPHNDLPAPSWHDCPAQSSLKLKANIKRKTNKPYQTCYMFTLFTLFTSLFVTSLCSLCS